MGNQQEGDNSCALKLSFRTKMFRYMFVTNIIFLPYRCL